MTAVTAILLLRLMMSVPAAAAASSSETILDLERRFSAALAGKQTTGAFAFTHVWVRASDRWRLSSSHVTTISR